MRINIAERLKPFSHVPGISCLLPGSTLRLQIYPSLIRVDDLAGPHPIMLSEITMNVKGPVKDFTVQQDLEKGNILVWGHGSSGYFRHKQEAENRYQPNHFERLSLGSHKAQQWPQVHFRLSFDEIFPHWVRLAQWIPPQKNVREGTLVLLDACEEAILSNRPETILPVFQKLYMASFEGMLSPRLQDTDFQGFEIPTLTPTSSATPLTLLKEGARLIRSLFFSTNNREARILEALPPEFHCGRFLGLDWPGVGTVDLEWSKKRVRRVILNSQSSGEIFLNFKDVKQYRLRYESKEPATHLPGTLILERGTYLLDNFQQQ